MRTSSSVLRPLSAAAALLAATLLLAACSARLPGDVEDPPGVAGDTELPEWLERVYPEPGAVTTARREVQVSHTVTDPAESIQLFVDDVDVTTYAEEGRGQLTYDPDEVGGGERGPVELEPGQHSARVDRVAVDPESGLVAEVLESFSWEFDVQ